MAARYLLRFDDISPTMDWEAWAHVEAALCECNARPILAVVPDNRDEHLRVEEPHPHFWDEVRRWQGLGWAIGLHGYQHHYVTSDAGLLGLHPRSEFAGLSAAQQESKMRAAVEVFRREHVRPDAWVAPAHSFDDTTLEVLRKIGITRISDGFSLYPHVDDAGMMWIPQQMWRLRWMPFGVWTVCFHHNEWDQRDIERFGESIKRYKSAIVSLEDVSARYRARRRSWIDALLARLLLALVRVKVRASH